MTSTRPVSRRVAIMWAAVGLLAIVGLVALTSWLRLEVQTDDAPPSAGAGVAVVPDDDAVDPLRDEITCPPPPDEEETGLDRRPLPITSTQLYDCPRSYDGRVVQFTGEVVGGLLERRDGIWAQLNDDAYGTSPAGPLPAHRDFRGSNTGVGVLLPPGADRSVHWIGGPGRRGDVLEVAGRFHRTDRATGEVAIIRADEVRVVERGSATEGGDAPRRPVVASIAALLALTAVLLERRVRAGR